MKTGARSSARVLVSGVLSRSEARPSARDLSGKALATYVLASAKDGYPDGIFAGVKSRSGDDAERHHH